MSHRAEEASSAGWARNWPALDAAWLRMGWPRPVRLEAIGGSLSLSDRAYARAHFPDGRAAVACRYGETPENAAFAPLAKHLRRMGVPVPGILHDDPGARLVVQEDLGGASLQEVAGRLDGEAAARTLVEALETVRPLHETGEAGAPAGLPLQRPFDEQRYLFETGYFAEAFLGIALAHPLSASEHERWGAERRRMARELAAEPRRLIHRDFQSANILVRGGRLFVIDFQGMRFGLPEYDLASLALDPYAQWPPPARAAAQEAFLARHPASERPRRLRLCRLCAAQRLMQALATFAKFGAEPGHETCLAHIPPALAFLRETLANLPDFPFFQGLADRLGDWARTP